MEGRPGISQLQYTPTSSMPKPSSSIHTHAHASPIPRDKTSQLGETYLESPLGETHLEHECPPRRWINLGKLTRVHTSAS